MDSAERMLALTEGDDGAVEVSEAVSCARRAAAAWSALPQRERFGRLRAFRRRLAQRGEQIAATVSAELQRPLQDALGAEILPAIAALDWLLRAAPGHMQSLRISGSVELSAAPLGVIGVIGTWNYPVYLNLTTICWALAAGNAVVWKPSEYAVDTCHALAEMLSDCRLPVTTVQGGPLAGQSLCHAGCDKIAFTGGYETGRRILAALAEHATPAVMELSGCDGMIVRADADIAAAARSAVWARCSSAGQSCVAPQRIFVEARCYDAFLTSCAAALQGLRGGTDYGPMRTPQFASQAAWFVQDALSRGARIAAGTLENRSGACMPPILLADCTPDMTVMTEGFFGPVLAVMRTAGDEEAVARLNDCRFALGASIWTADLEAGRAMAQKLEVGLVSINEVLLDAADPSVPFGGRRASGFGKQRGKAGLDEFIGWKAIATHRSGGARRHLFPYRPQTVELLRSVLAWQAADSFGERMRAAVKIAKAAVSWRREERDEPDREENANG